MTEQPTLLQQAKNIPVPEPGTGEVVILSSVELFCTWMKLNDLKFKEWRGGLMVVTANTLQLPDADQPQGDPS